ncbi:hypothetical protein UPYG_G00153970 [Umbra pygmaea]|uniref:Ig-like domain-containing protein n=1 Tax=Umbra pygmaea TaxID=75934 RepID=A0ABD0WY47_UMBPY
MYLLVLLLSTLLLYPLSEGPQTPTLIVVPSGGQVYAEETVILVCELPGQLGLNWQFYWHKDRQDTGAVKWALGSAQGVAAYTLQRASGKHTGQYWCRAGKGQPVFYTQYSQAVSVNVTEIFTAVTLLASPSTVIKEGAAFNLTCEALLTKQSHVLSDPDQNVTTMVVTFTFMRNGWPVLTNSVSGLYSVAHANTCHTGTYRCVARSGKAKRTSHDVTITLDTLSLTLVAIFGTILILFVGPVAFILRKSILIWRAAVPH